MVVVAVQAACSVIRESPENREKIPVSIDKKDASSATKESKRRKRKWDGNVGLSSAHTEPSPHFKRTDGIALKLKKKQKGGHAVECDIANADVSDLTHANNKEEEWMETGELDMLELKAKHGQRTRCKGHDIGSLEVLVERGKSKRNGQDPDEMEEQSPRPEKKKRKMASIHLPNPEDDATLTDQARKALLYAYAQFNDPSSWKFNKARQNWLIRNIWSDQTIPDVYIPLLTMYLSHIRGGAREKLVKSCQNTLGQVPVAPVAESDVARSSCGDEVIPSTLKGENEGSKSVRARAVWTVLSASE